MEIEIEKMSEHATQLASKLAAFDWSPTLGQEVRKEVLQGVRDNFTSSVDPDGKRWKPRKNKGNGHPLLIDTGRLLQSAVGTGGGRVSQVSGAELTVGTRVPYAAYHNAGTSRLPKREFMGVQKKRLKNIDKIIADAGLGAFDE